MSCSPFDLRDYMLGELAAPDRRQVEQHVAACSDCREELARLDLTQAALRSLPDEEIPQRIGFVSDKVFAPSPWRRAIQTFWGSSARLGFTSAALLSFALVVTALHRPVPAPAGGAPVSASAQVDTVRLEAQLTGRVNEAVRKAVAESEARQTQKMAELIQVVEKRHDFDRQALMMAVSQNMEVLRKERSVALHAANDLAASQQGEVQ